MGTNATKCFREKRPRKFTPACFGPLAYSMPLVSSNTSKIHIAEAAIARIDEPRISSRFFTASAQKKPRNAITTVNPITTRECKMPRAESECKATAQAAMTADDCP